MSDQFAEFTSKARAVISKVRKEYLENPDEGWTTSRRLSRPNGQPRTESNEGYTDILPLFDGKNFIQHIEAKVAQNGQASLLDIGCGSGLALLDLREVFPADKLKIVGIGHESDIHRPIRDIPRGLFRDATAQDLEKAGISFIPANFVDIQRVLPKNSFDIAIAVFSLDWIKYPNLALLKKVWHLLKPQGIAFISPFDVTLRDYPHIASLFKTLREEYGLNFQQGNGGVSFKKTEDHLPNKFLADLHYRSAVTKK